MKKPNGYWTKERCQEKIIKEAQKYCNRIEFKKNSAGAYNRAVKSGIMNMVCSHMNTKKIIRWTKELAHIEALKYNNNTDFIKGPIKAYRVAQKFGYLDEIRSHMKNNKTNGL